MMNKRRFVKIKKGQPLVIKYMLGPSHATEDVSLYEYDKELREDVLVESSTKDSVNVCFTGGPWAGKEYAFTSNEIV